MLRENSSRQRTNIFRWASVDKPAKTKKEFSTEQYHISIDIKQKLVIDHVHDQIRIEPVKRKQIFKLKDSKKNSIQLERRSSISFSDIQTIKPSCSVQNKTLKTHTHFKQKNYSIQNQHIKVQEGITYEIETRPSKKDFSLYSKKHQFQDYQEEQYSVKKQGERSLSSNVYFQGEQSKDIFCNMRNKREFKQYKKVSPFIEIQYVNENVSQNIPNSIRGIKFIHTSNQSRYSQKKNFNVLTPQQMKLKLKQFIKKKKG